MDNNLSRNLKYIKKYNSQLAFRIEKHTEIRSVFELKDALSGAPLLIKDGVSIHDETDPEQEAIKIFNQTEHKGKFCINAIFGLGLGYLFKRFAKSSKGKIILYENDLDILRVVFELVDFSEELSNENIMVVSSYEEIEAAYKKMFFLDYNLNFCFLNYNKYRTPEAMNLAMKHFSDIHSVYQSNYNNYRQKAQLWTYSALKSVYYSSKSSDVSVLKNKFLGKTALIISAGPSLDKNIHLVKENRDKFVVFCVGRVLNKVVANGIKPDFVVQIEYLEDAWLQIKDYDFSDTYLIIQPMSYYDIHKIKAKKTFYYYAINDNTSKWLATAWGIDYSQTKNMGTVSVVAAFSAKLMGFKNIIFIGQDLANSGGKTYSKGTTIQNDFKENKDSGKLEITRSEKELFPVKGQIEEVVYAPADYALFIKYFETIAKEWTDINLVNSTEGGAYLEGFEHIALKDSIEKYQSADVDLDETIGSIKNVSNKDVYKRQFSIKNKLKVIKKINKEIAEKYKDIAQEQEKRYYDYTCEGKSESIELKKELVAKYAEIFKKTVNSIKSNDLTHDVFYILIQSVEDAFRRFEKDDEDCLNRLYYTLSMYIVYLYHYGAPLFVSAEQALKDLEKSA